MTRKAAFKATQDINAILALSDDEQVKALAEAGIHDDDCMEKSGIELLREQLERQYALSEEEFPLPPLVDDEQELRDALAEADNETSILLRTYYREFPDIRLDEDTQEGLWDGGIEMSDVFYEANLERKENAEKVIGEMLSQDGRSRFKVLCRTMEAEYTALGHPLRYIPKALLCEYISEILYTCGMTPFAVKANKSHYRIRITHKANVELWRKGRRICCFKLPAIYRKWAKSYKAKQDAKPAGSIAAEVQELVDTAKK